MKDKFLPFINNRKNECDTKRDIPKDLRGRMCLSYQTIEDLPIISMRSVLSQLTVACSELSIKPAKRRDSHRLIVLLDPQLCQRLYVSSSINLVICNTFFFRFANYFV